MSEPCLILKRTSNGIFQNEASIESEWGRLISTIELL
jgi:hypothetical protein